MKLTEGEVHLYFSRSEQISEPELLRRYESLLSADERTRMARFYHARHRHQFLVTRALVRSSLAAYFAVDPSDLVFGTNEYGKPGIRSPDGRSPVSFNLSHASGLIVCAVVLNHQIGVDVEDTRRNTRAAFNELSAYFAKREIEDIQSLPAERQRDRFFDYWTLKEAYIKARGTGFSTPLDKFSFGFLDNDLVEFSVQPELEDDAGDWKFWRFPMDGRYRVAVAVNCGNIDFKIKAVNSVPLQNSEPIQLNYL